MRRPPQLPRKMSCPKQIPSRSRSRGRGRDPSLLFAQGMGDLPPQRLLSPSRPESNARVHHARGQGGLVLELARSSGDRAHARPNQPSTDIPLDADDLPRPQRARSCRHCVSHRHPALDACAPQARASRSVFTPLHPVLDALAISAPSPELAGLSQEGAARSRGSSTAVSDADYPSEEGTVVDVDADMELETPAKAREDLGQAQGRPRGCGRRRAREEQRQREHAREEGVSGAEQTRAHGRARQGCAWRRHQPSGRTRSPRASPSPSSPRCPL
ncbi:hypothetical protein C8Q80DRAFT_441107 [Daedaleopsis nitida]|nr:hypothetical protein C8Q80DRAFT_441107 [Daedaleopsis nitida]